MTTTPLYCTLWSFHRTSCVATKREPAKVKVEVERTRTLQRASLQAVSRFCALSGARSRSIHFSRAALMIAGLEGVRHGLPVRITEGPLAKHPQPQAPWTGSCLVDSSESCRPRREMDRRLVALQV